jgi:hypothetical protein
MTHLVILKVAITYTPDIPFDDSTSDHSRIGSVVYAEPSHEQTTPVAAVHVLKRIVELRSSSGLC